MKLTKRLSSREHIFPKFLLNSHCLWEQKITLLNGMTLPYRKVVIPCCRRCNNEYIGRLDQVVSTAMKNGYRKFKNINEVTLFQWLSRILYCMLYLELITPRDPRFKRRKILKQAFFRTLETVFIFLNSIRVETTFLQPYPWSIFIFKTQRSRDIRRNFDFKDNPLSLTIALRANDIGVVAALQDNGAVKKYGDQALGIKFARKVDLHPVQFGEITARIFCAASLINRVPKYINIASANGKMNIMALPLGGFSSKPIFDEWKNEDFARFLAWSSHLPYESLYSPERGVRTCLHDDQGTPQYIPVDGD